MCRPGCAPTARREPRERRGGHHAKPIISGVYHLDEINEALGAAETRQNLTAVIVP
jgi:hypothetical protein